MLLVEDDPRVRRVLRLALEDEGYQVTEAGTAAEGLCATVDQAPCVVLLDIMLPDRDGFTVCREIRHTSTVPIIMISARGDSHDVVGGLEAGADDYVRKPVVAKELAARIRALHRRADANRSAPRRYEHDGLVVGLEEADVTVDGRPVSLTRTEFRLLSELVAARGRVCSREQLLDRVWGYDYFGDSRIVDVHVRRLRTKIERDPANPRRVVTARGLGYRLVA